MFLVQRMKVSWGHHKPAVRQSHLQTKRFVPPKLKWNLQCFTRTSGLWPLPRKTLWLTLTAWNKLERMFQLKLVLFLKDEDKLWVKEEDVVMSNFWTSLTSVCTTCNTFLQNFTRILPTNCCQTLCCLCYVTIGELNVGLKKRQRQQLRRSRK